MSNLDKSYISEAVNRKYMTMEDAEQLVPWIIQLIEESDAQESETAALKQENEQGREQLRYYEASIKDFRQELKQLRADKAVLLKCVEEIGEYGYSEWKPSVIARECLKQIGGTADES